METRLTLLNPKGNEIDLVPLILTDEGSSYGPEVMVLYKGQYWIACEIDGWTYMIDHLKKGDNDMGDKITVTVEDYRKENEKFNDTTAPPFRVVKVVNDITPKVGEYITELRVKDLCQMNNTTVNILPPKKD